MQLIFDAIHYGFEWTEDGWYQFDAKAAEKAARKARDARARELRAEGRQVQCFTLGSQLRTMGGIGSGKPQIEVVTKAYGLNATSAWLVPAGY